MKYISKKTKLVLIEEEVLNEKLKQVLSNCLESYLDDKINPQVNFDRYITK